MKKTKISLTLATLLAALTLAACGNDDVSFDALEVERTTANANSHYTAVKWRGDNGFGELNILGRGDSTQQANCPQGDGWASVDLIDAKTKQVQVSLKCSTVSAAVGCYLAQDFKARPALASQENSCNKTLPAHLKKIEQ